MPALSNPRHERFALAIFAGLGGKTRIDRAQSTAYLQAYPNCKPGNSAEAAASQLLRRIKPIMERVRELQAQFTERQTVETKQKLIDELNTLRAEAQSEKSYSAAVSAVMGKAKILNLETQTDSPHDFNSAQSMQDIGRTLLQAVGFSSPDDVSIQAAIAANNAFIDRLNEIRDTAQELTIDQDD